MKHYTGLIFRQIRGHARRSALTLVSIILSVALVASVSVIAASIQQTQVNQVIALTGDFHGTFRDLRPDELARLQKAPGVEAAGASGPLGSALLDNLTVTLEAFDPTGRELLNLHLAEGRFPSAAGEIALEGWLLDLMDPRPQLGEAFELSFFPALLPSSEGYGTQVQEGQFALVGVLENIPAAQINKVSLGLLSPESLPAFLPADQTRYNAFVRMAGDASQARAGLENLGRSLGFPKDQLSPNEMLLDTLESGQEAQGPILLLAGLVLAAAAATIYNIFQISVVEQVRLFGTLRTLGATPGQIRVLVIGEALVLCAAAIPIGLGLGIGTAAILARTLKILQSLVGVVAVPGMALWGAAAVGLGATLVSALAPAQYAARLSPISAIRGSGNVRGQTSFGRFGQSGLLRKLSGFTGCLAYHNMRRSTGRTLVTLFSLGLGMALFVVFSAYAGNMDASNIASHFIRGDYAILSNDMRPGDGYPEQTRGYLAGQPAVAELISTRISNMVYSLLPAEEMDAEARARLEGMMGYEEMYETFGEPGTVTAGSQLFGYNNEDLYRMRASLVEGSLQPEEMAIRSLALVEDPHGVTGLQVGDTFKLKTMQRDGEVVTHKEETFVVAGIISDIPVSMGYGTVGPRLVVHEDRFKAFTGSSLYQRFDLVVDPSASLDQVEGMLEGVAKQSTSGHVLSYREVLANFEKEKRDILLLAYGVVAVIAIIGLVNITNTLVTQLLLRTREYGMLRAVGMTGRQLLAMTRIEAFFYAILGSILGLVLGGILSKVLESLMQAQDASIQLSFPWQSTLWAVLASIFISILATVQPARRMMKLHIVEALRFIE